MDKVLYFIVGAGVLSMIINLGSGRVRRGEEKNDDRFEHEAHPHKLYWPVAHMRDDVSIKPCLG